MHGIKDRINTNPDFQRPAVWSRAQKQLLVDTILREYDIPKLYWRKISSKPDRYDVVDGQQRLRAIWEFFDGEFTLPKDADLIDDEPVAGLHYAHLPDDLRMRFDVYALDVVILEESDEDEVREMFLRLQNGTSLKAQEKRNAYTGPMRAFVRQLVGHPFFNSVGFANSRFNHDLVAAQMVCLELAGAPTNIKNGDLNRMYKNDSNFDPKSAEAKSVQRTLNMLAEAFPEKTPELERFNVISLYCVISEMYKQYAFDQIRPLLHDWFLEFETDRRNQEQRADDEIDPEWASYKEKISHSTDAADSVRWRMDFMLRHFLERNPSIQRKDNQRSFTYVQRLAVFRRDKGHCQLRIKCDGAKLTWDDWHCDHSVPWTSGGKTTVENARAACTTCNLTKGAALPSEDRTKEPFIYLPTSPTNNGPEFRSTKVKIQQLSTKARHPNALDWLITIPELQNHTHLSTWKAICDHLNIDVGGDSARRRLEMGSCSPAELEQGPFRLNPPRYTQLLSAPISRSVYIVPAAT